MAITSCSNTANLWRSNKNAASVLTRPNFNCKQKLANTLPDSHVARTCHKRGVSLVACEGRLAPLQKRLRPFAHICGRKTQAKRFRLVVEPGFDAVLAADQDRFEDAAQGLRRACRELLGQCIDFRVEFFRRDYAREHAQRMRAVRIDRCGGSGHIHRLTTTGQARATVRAARAQAPALLASQ